VAGRCGIQLRQLPGAGGRSHWRPRPAIAWAEEGAAPGLQAARGRGRERAASRCEFAAGCRRDGSVWRKASTPSAWVPRRRRRQLPTLPGSSPQRPQLMDRVGRVVVDFTDRRSTQFKTQQAQPGGQCSATVAVGPARHGPGKDRCRWQQAPSEPSAEQPGWPPQSVGRPLLRHRRRAAGDGPPRPGSWARATRRSSAALQPRRITPTHAQGRRTSAAAPRIGASSQRVAAGWPSLRMGACHATRPGRHLLLQAQAAASHGWAAHPRVSSVNAWNCIAASWKSRPAQPFAATSWLSRPQHRGAFFVSAIEAGRSPQGCARKLDACGPSSPFDKRRGRSSAPARLPGGHLRCEECSRKFLQCCRSPATSTVVTLTMPRAMRSSLKPMDEQFITSRRSAPATRSTRSALCHARKPVVRVNHQPRSTG